MMIMRMIRYLGLDRLTCDVCYGGLWSCGWEVNGWSGCMYVCICSLYTLRERQDKGRKQERGATVVVLYATTNRTKRARGNTTQHLALQTEFIVPPELSWE